MSTINLADLVIVTFYYRYWVCCNLHNGESALHNNKLMLQNDKHTANSSLLSCNNKE